MNHEIDQRREPSGAVNHGAMIAIATAGLAVMLLGLFLGRENSDSLPDENLLASFRGQSALDRADYDGLAIYFMQGFEHFRTSSGSAAAYPGLPSDHGAYVDQIEGFSRMAPLWGVWVASGRAARVRKGRNAEVDVAAAFRRGLLSGTDKNSKTYWGPINDDDQRIVEASDIALALWLLRNQVWAAYNAAEKKQVVEWLQQVNGKQVPDNNWHLFVVFVDAVLDKLAAVDNRAEALKHYSRIKQFYRGEGWFSDGPDNVYDYYNAWGIHYQLFWLEQVAPEWDKRFIDDARRQFVSSYRLLMTPAGFPMIGRSVCYRMAAPVPLILDQLDEKRIDAAEARRALDTAWRYFIQHGGVKEGNITQGYCGADARILDHYSGPASCLWGLRSLIAALYQPRDGEFWHANSGMLAVEKSDFDIAINSIGWRVRGTKQTGDVSIRRMQGEKIVTLTSVSAQNRLMAAITGKLNRPDNHGAKYDDALYSSANPFCGCK